MSNVAASPALATQTPGKALNIALWVVQGLTALLFFMAGGHKLTGDPQMVSLFALIGIGQWFRYITGLLEVAGGLLLLVPRASGLGGALLVPVMLGAVLTHLTLLHNSPAVPAALLAASLFVVWGRRAKLAALARRVRG